MKTLGLGLWTLDSGVSKLQMRESRDIQMCVAVCLSSLHKPEKCRRLSSQPMRSFSLSTTTYLSITSHFGLLCDRQLGLRLPVCQCQYCRHHVKKVNYGTPMVHPA